MKPQDQLEVSGVCHDLSETYGKIDKGTFIFTHQKKKVGPLTRLSLITVDNSADIVII